MLQKYFQRMQEVRSTSGGTSEMPYYGAIEDLINGLGKAMRPAIICNSQLKDMGAGRPDFGLFSEKQCSRPRKEKTSAERPDYGVGEIKPLSMDMEEIENLAQVARYLDKYGSVLLTNYRQFRFIKLIDSKGRKETEQYDLAGSEEAFWKLAKKPQASGKKHGEEMAKLFIRSISPVRINRPEELAERLALHAQDALKALGGKDAEIPAMLRSALEESTGTKFKKNKKDNHFLRSTLVQTVFYGIFSAWVVCRRASSQNSFHWKEVGDWLKIPAITALFDEIAKTSNLEKLRIKKSLERAVSDLDCIDSEAFFKNFSDEMVIQYFYEPFLRRFDPKLQKESGVWYTPREIVKYMVARVDRVLQDELGIEDGLANKQVQVLDPCCGTGAFIIEVLKKIEERLLAKNPDSLVGQDIKEAALERIFGFELLPAPFIIAHWQVANLLANHVKGRPALEKNERPAIYLTNALTGWEEGAGQEMDYLFAELKDEKEKADEVKRDKKILVVIGNPPYDAFAKTDEEEDPTLVEAYIEGLHPKWGISRHSLKDLYVRFFRIAEKRIQKTGRGIVSYVSNYSWTEEPSFVVMRQKLLQTFDKLWIEDMHGNSRKREKAHDGKTSESIFRVPEYSSGISQGVAISLAVKKEGGGGRGQGQVLYRGDIDNAKAADRRQALLESLGSSDFDGNYETAKPEEVNWFSLRP